MSFPKPDLGALLRGLALCCGALAAVMYLWGLLHLLGAVLDAEDSGTDSAPVRPCRTAGWLERGGAEIVDYSVSYVPLRFVCETRGGGSYVADSVPGYVNPGVVGFALAGAALAVGAGYDAELRARRARRAATPPGEEPRITG